LDFGAFSIEQKAIFIVLSKRATTNAQMRNKGMCDQCFEIDKKIDHYRTLASLITDQLMLDGIKQLIERMQAQKAALHPEQQR
jgi:hypothetical protein